MTARWSFDPLIVFAWLGIVLIGVFGWGVPGLLVAGPLAGASLAAGWILAYGHYELQHAMAHRRGPTGRYTRWLRRHHFHHHFGHPMANHGVTTGFWDRVFGTYEAPDRVRVPRRMAPAWMVDAEGRIRSDYADDYEMVGTAGTADERLAMLDRVRAFASVAPSA